MRGRVPPSLPEITPDPLPAVVVQDKKAARVDVQEVEDLEVQALEEEEEERASSGCCSCERLRRWRDGVVRRVYWRR